MRLTMLVLGKLLTSLVVVWVAANRLSGSQPIGHQSSYWESRLGSVFDWQIDDSACMRNLSTNYLDGSWSWRCSHEMGQF